MNIKEELARLERMTTGELAGRYVEVCGEPIRTRNRAYLTRKIAWRLQAMAEGDLSERAWRRAAEQAKDGVYATHAAQGRGADRQRPGAPRGS